MSKCITLLALCGPSVWYDAVMTVPREHIYKNGKELHWGYQNNYGTRI